MFIHDLNKAIVISILISVIALVTYGSYTYMNSYRSAFEADQACHYDANIRSDQNITYKCDHDLETRQWLLYSLENTKAVTKVIERYHY